MPPTVKHLSKLAVLLLGVTLVVGMIVLFQFNRAGIDKELVTLYLLPQPEKLTELYFNDNANLPSTVASNQTISFAFVIHNLETTDYQYIYEVSVNINGTKQIVDSGNVLVKNGQYYVKHEKFNLTDSAGNQEVVVELLNKQQAIDFRMGK